MKRLCIAALLAMTCVIAAYGSSSSADRSLLDRAAKKLQQFGVVFDKKTVTLLGTREETVARFKDHPDLEKILHAVAFSSPGKNEIFINTWEPTLWKNIADPRIQDDELLQSAAVVAASLIAHELGHISFGVSELVPHQSELEVLLFFQRKGVKNLEIPIEETRKAIAALSPVAKA